MGKGVKKFLRIFIFAKTRRKKPAQNLSKNTYADGLEEHTDRHRQADVRGQKTAESVFAKAMPRQAAGGNHEI